MKWMMTLAALVALAACTTAATLLPMNDAALAAGTPALTFVRGGSRGAVTVMMPDGEELNGEFRVVNATTAAFEFGAGGASAAFAQGGGRSVSVTASGPHTILNCEGVVGDFGGGTGVCETNRGARYRANF